MPSVMLSWPTQPDEPPELMQPKFLLADWARRRLPNGAMIYAVSTKNSIFRARAW